MPLAPGLLVRTLVHPGGRRTTVVVRRGRAPARLDRSARTALSEPDRARAVPRTAGETAIAMPAPAEVAARFAAPGFTPPVVRALAVLADRARLVGADAIALDGRRVPLMRLVAEANRRLLAAGRVPIRYPGLGSAGTDR